MESNLANCHWINLELYTVSCHKQPEKLLLLSILSMLKVKLDGNIRKLL